MKIIINSKVLSLPPYLSTNWENITSLHIEENEHQKVLIVFLNSGLQVKIPGLDNGLIDAIFTKHAQFLDQKPAMPSSGPMTGKESIEIPNVNLETLLAPFKLGDMNINMIGNFMHHNSEQKNAPDLPKEVLEKVKQMMSMMPPEEMKHLPKAEPHCNCFYCQIARAITDQEEPQEELEEEVTEEDLQFKEWDINQKGTNLYIVTNPLDQSQEFQVFLGDPIGCTCGKKNCEHIEAVLRS